MIPAPRGGKPQRATIWSLVAVLLFMMTPGAARAQRVGDYEGLFGARWGGAQRQSLYLGVARVTRAGSEVHAGYHIELEAGRSAGQVAVGVNSQGQMTPIARVQLVGMRTWRKPTDLAPGQTYAGVEAQLALLVGVSYGVYWRVNGDVPGDARYHALRFVVGL